jgi:hypothetical protein
MLTEFWPQNLKERGCLMDLKEIECEGVDWIILARDVAQCQVSVHIAVVSYCKEFCRLVGRLSACQDNSASWTYPTANMSPCRLIDTEFWFKSEESNNFEVFLCYTHHVYPAVTLHHMFWLFMKTQSGKGYSSFPDIIIAEFEALTVVIMKSFIVWDMMPCSPLKVTWHFRGMGSSILLTEARNQPEIENKSTCFTQVSWLAYTVLQFFITSIHYFYNVVNETCG